MAALLALRGLDMSADGVARTATWLKAVDSNVFEVEVWPLIIAMNGRMGYSAGYSCLVRSASWQLPGKRSLQQKGLGARPTVQTLPRASLLKRRHVVLRSPRATAEFSS